MRRWIVTVLCVITGVLQAADTVLEAESAKLDPGVVYRDESASGGRCVVLLMPGGRAKHTLQLATELPAGDYEVAWYLQAASLPTMHFLEVKLQSADSDISLGQALFSPASTYQPMSLRCLHKGGVLELNLTATCDSGFDGMREAMSEAEKEGTNRALLENQGALAGLKDDDKGTADGLDVLNLLEEEKGVDTLGFSDTRLMIDKVVIRPIRQPVAMVTDVEVNKIHYLPGETVQAAATVIATGKPGEYELVALDITEIDARREVYRQTVKAGATSTVSFTYPAGDQEFGHALQVALLRDGKEVHSHKALYGLSANVYRVGITANAGPQDTRTFTKEKGRALMERNKALYANYFERFAWAPCDYSNLAPKTEIFYSGQTQYPGSITGFQNLLNEAHRVGIKGITYGKACAGGIDGFHTCRRFPELFRSRIWGLPSEAFNVFYLERMLEGDYLLSAKPIDGGWQHWASLWVDWSNPRTVTYGAECIIDSVKMFGWDGVRWDGHFVGAQQPFIDMLDKAYPHFVHGYNIAFANPASDTFLPPANHVDDFHTVAANHGLMMDESVRNWSHSNFSPGLIRPFYAALAREADYIKRIGGLPLFITFDMRSPQDLTFNVLCGLAAGQRYTYITSPGDFAYGSLPKFLTRYSAFIWDDTARVAEPEKIISLTAPEGATPPWFDQTTWLRTLPDGRQQLLIHLLNPPGYNAFCNRVQPPATYLQDVKLQLQPPEGATLGRVVHISPDLPAGHEELAWDNHSVTIPELRHYSIVAIDLEGAPTPAYALTTPVETAQAILAKQAEAQAKKDQEARAQAGIAPSAEEPEKPVNLDEAYVDKLERPESLALRRNGILDVHHARGAFSWLNPIDSAVGLLGGGDFEPSWVDFVGFKLRDKGCMDGFPDSYDRLLREDVLVLDNLHVRYLGWKRRLMIMDFVRNGGGVLFFSGYENLSQGRDAQTTFNELIPVEIDHFNALETAPEGFPLTIADPDFAPGLELTGTALSVEASPLRDNVRVLVKAGAHPAIVAHTVGKGRVITVLINPHGDFEGRQLQPYYEGASWPRLLAACLKWLANGYTEKVAYVSSKPQIDPSKPQPLDLITSFDMTSAQFTKALREAQVNVVDAESAQFMLQAIADNPDKIDDMDLLGKLLPKLEPYFDPSWAPVGKKLIQSQHPFLRAAGCQILGLAEDKAYAPSLEKALKDSDPDVTRQALIGLAAAGTAESIPPIRRFLNANEEQHLLALMALIRLGDSSALAEALPVYDQELRHRTRLRSGRRSAHEDLYGGVSFKLTPQQRKVMTIEYNRIKKVEAQLVQDLDLFAASFPAPTDAQLAIWGPFLQEADNRRLLPLTYALYSRLSPAQRDQLAAYLTAAKLQDLRWLAEKP